MFSWHQRPRARRRPIDRRRSAVASRRRSLGRRLRGEQLEQRALLSSVPTLVKDINVLGGVAPRLTAVGDDVFFFARDPTRGYELFKSDGSAAGTFLVKDIKPGPAGSNPWFLTDVAGTLYFRADDGIHGDRLWKSDGTETGTVLVRGFSAAPVYSSISEMVAVGSTLFMRVRTGDNTYELWTSDGTEFGTVMLAGPFSDNAPPYSMAAVDDRLFFSASQGTGGGAVGERRHRGWYSPGARHSARADRL